MIGNILGTNYLTLGSVMIGTEHDILTKLFKMNPILLLALRLKMHLISLLIITSGYTKWVI